MSMKDNLKTEKAKERYDRNYNSVKTTFTQKELVEHNREISSRAFDAGKKELANAIMKFVNSNNRGNADYFIVDKIEELCMKYVD